jgi:four helix bundle protein
MNNIAEGFGRFSNNEFIRFLNIATASIDEVHSMIILYSEMNYITQDQKAQSIELLKKSKHQSLGLIKYLNTKL